MMTAPQPQRLTTALLLVLLLAGAVRFGFLYKNWNNLDFAPSFLAHGEVARNILHGQWFKVNQSHLQNYVQECYRQEKLIDPQDFPAPQEEILVPLYNDEGGYGLLLASVWKITGSYRWWYLRVLQILLDVVMCWLVYRIGRKVFDERVGLLAALFYACFIPGVELAVRAHRDIWVTFLFIFSVYQFVSLAKDGNNVWRLLSIGISTGLVAWMRSTVLLFIILAIPLLFLTVSRKEALRSAAILLVGFILTFSPLIVRNYVVFNKFMATRGAFWHSFWAGIGQMPNPYNLRDDDETVFQFARTLDPDVQFDTEQYEQVLKAEAKKFVGAHPFWYAGSVVKRALVFVFPKIGRALFFQEPLPQHVVGTINLSFGKFFLLVFDGAMGVLCFIGIWLMRKRWRELLTLGGPYLYTLATLAPFYLAGRNIMNVYFVVLIMASVTLLHIWELFKPRTQQTM
jgi:4-amino-4-deoxy-L-arabinose transferase-like glycosyltransferase